MSSSSSLSDQAKPRDENSLSVPLEKERSPMAGNADVHEDAAIEKRPQPTDVEQGVSQKPQGPPASHFDPRQNPDGGTQAWLCVLGGFCTLFCSFGWINCIGVFQNYYELHLTTYSPSTISWISSLETFFMFFFGPVIGKIYDNYGPRWLVLTGSFLEVFGLMMTSLSTKYYQYLLAQGIVSSVGASMIFYPAMSSITTWFFHKRATAFGIIAAGSSVGGVIFPIMVQRLINEIGFPWAMRISGFLMLFLLVIANLTITSRMKPHKSPFRPIEFILPLKEIVYDIVLFGCFLFFLGMFLPINYLILEAHHFGMSENLAQYLPSILNAASFFGRVLPGIIGDKIGRFNIAIIMNLFTGIITLALWLPATANAPILVFTVLFGMGSGAFVSLSPSLIAQISDVRKIGVRTGTFFAVISVAALISNPIGGQILERWNGDYQGLQIFAGVMCTAGAITIAIARVKLAGMGLTVKV